MLAQTLSVDTDNFLFLAKQLYVRYIYVLEINMKSKINLNLEQGLEARLWAFIGSLRYYP